MAAVTHPDFDSKHVTLRNSMNVDSIVEEGGLEDGVAVDCEGSLQPFIESRIFDQDTEAYVTFPSRADAMLASLQLFHTMDHRYHLLHRELHDRVCHRRSEIAPHEEATAVREW